MWSCTAEIRGMLLLNECTDTSNSCCRKICVHYLPVICDPYPKGTQYLPLLATTAGAEGKWLFPDCSSTWHANADIHSVGHGIFHFHAVHGRKQLVLRSVSESELSPFSKELCFQVHFEDWCPGHDSDHCHFLYFQMWPHQLSLCLLLNSGGTWSQLRAYICYTNRL